MGARRKKSKKPSATKAERLLERTVFFADVCLGRQLSQALKDSGWAVKFHLDHFPQDTPDEVWLPVVGDRGWVVLTKDKNIRRKPAERAKIIASKVRLFTLPGGNMTGEEMVERFRSSSARIARFLNNTQAPFVAVVQADNVVNIPLQE
jgi:hypothetical protein